MKLSFDVSPYANQHGTIDAPDNLPEEKWEEYIQEHFKDAQLEEAEFSYVGIDIDNIEVE